MAITTPWQFYLGEDVERICKQAETGDDTGSIDGRNYSCTIARRSSATPILELSMGAGIVISNAAEREYTISLTAEQTALLTPGHYRWYTKRVDDGVEAVLGTGPCVIEPAPYPNPVLVP